MVGRARVYLDSLFKSEAKPSQQSSIMTKHATHAANISPFLGGSVAALCDSRLPY